MTDPDPAPPSTPKATEPVDDISDLWWDTAAPLPTLTAIGHTQVLPLATGLTGTGRTWTASGWRIHQATTTNNPWDLDSVTPAPGGIALTQLNRIRVKLQICVKQDKDWNSSLKPRRERLAAGYDIILILICIIGPFILECSNPNAIPWLMLSITALGGLYGFSIFHITPRRPIFGFAAIGLYVVILWLLVDIRNSFSPTYLNWVGGFLAGLMVGGWPKRREEETEVRRRREPAPGWHLNNQEFAAVSLIADRALAAFRGLDGATHYFLCVTFGPSRIDIVGHHEHGLVVLCTPDVHDGKNWSILTGPSTNQQIVEFNAGPDHTKLPANNLVDASPAQKALEYFIAYQRPDPTLTWFTGPKVFARRPRSTRGLLSEKTWPKEQSTEVPS